MIPELNDAHFEDQTFEHLDAAEIELVKKSFTRCTFQNCQFFETTFDNCRFEKCHFLDSDLSMAKVKECTWLDVQFEKCKLMGINWTLSKNLHILDMDFKGCVLTYGSFMGLDLKNLTFEDCLTKGVNFGESDLTDVGFIRCDLSESDFLHTNLTNADFRTAKNYAINLNDNKVEGAKFTFPEALSLLKSYNIIIEFDNQDQDED